MLLLLLVMVLPAWLAMVLLAWLVMVGQASLELIKLIKLIKLVFQFNLINSKRGF